MSDPIRIAAMMDPIGGITPSKDSTFGMLLAAHLNRYTIRNHVASFKASIS